LAFQDSIFLTSYVLFDDAFYYLKIASNIARGLGPTFDGINLTNGFQPLWELLLVLLAKVSGGDKELLLHLSMLVQAILLGISVYLMFTLQRTMRIPLGISIVGTIIWSLASFYLQLAMAGLEAGLRNVILLVCALVFLHSRRSPSPKPIALLGFLLGIQALARLDSIFMLASISALIFSDGLKRRSVRRSLLSLLCLNGFASVALSPWLLWNFLQFGHLMPVSGIVKIRPIASYGDLLLRLFWPLKLFLSLGTTLILAALLLLSAMGLAMITLFRLWGETSYSIRQHLALALQDLDFIMLFCVFVYLYYSVLFGHLRNWYSAPFLLAGVLLLAYFLSIFPSKVQIYLSGGILMIAVILFGLWAKFVCFNPEQNRLEIELYNTALWIRASTPENTIVGSWDAGVIGYFSERAVINLDGRVNTYGYLEIMRRKNYKSYFQAYHVRYIAQFSQLREGADTVFDLLGGTKEEWMLAMQPIYCSDLFRFPATAMYYRVGDAGFHVCVWELHDLR